MNNMAYFNEYTAKIFAKLYDNFPVKCELTAADFVETDEEWEVWESVVEWLTNEGYMNYTNSARGSFYLGCVLTSTGLQALNQVPDSLSSKDSYGVKLVKAVEAGSIDEAQKTIVEMSKKMIGTLLSGQAEE